MRLRVGLFSLAALCLASLASAKDHTVQLSYYGTSTFDVQPAVVNLETKEDTITFEADGPGKLILQLDDGTVYMSDDGTITLTADQIGTSRLTRCSMILEDGTLVGWHVDHDPRYGLQPEVPGVRPVPLGATPYLPLTGMLLSMQE